jgi:hypothetical protein
VTQGIFIVDRQIDLARREGHLHGLCLGRAGRHQGETKRCGQRLQEGFLLLIE